MQTALDRVVVNNRPIKGPITVGFTKGILTIQGQPPDVPLSPGDLSMILESVRQLLAGHQILAPGVVAAGQVREVGGEAFQVVQAGDGKALLASIQEYRERGLPTATYPSAPGLFNDIAIEVDRSGAMTSYQRLTSFWNAAEGPAYQVERLVVNAGPAPQSNN